MNVESLTISLLRVNGLRRNSGSEKSTGTGIADGLLQKLGIKCATWAEMTLMRPDSTTLKVKSTARHHPTGSCSFFEEFSFPLKSSHEMVQIELKERRGDVGRDRSLGSAELSLIRFANKEPHEVNLSVGAAMLQLRVQLS
jgi:hypothetical protein